MEGFYHFHIEAFDESITLSKMDRDLRVFSEEKVHKENNISQIKQKLQVNTHFKYTPEKQNRASSMNEEPTIIS